MTNLTTEPLLLLLGFIAACIAGAWKVFHELHVKPRDFRIDSLKDDMARLKAQLEVLEKQPLEPQRVPVQPTSATPVATEIQADPALTDGLLAPFSSESRPLDVSPATSLLSCYEAWEDSSKTKLQKQQFEKEWVGRQVHWRVIVESVGEASHGHIFIRVKDQNSQDMFGPRATLIFPETRVSELLSLSNGDMLIVSGKIREFFLNPMLDDPTLAKA